MEPLIALTLDGVEPNGRHRRAFGAGETLRIEYQIDAVESQQIVATEASVLWFTEGKGEPDMGVHFFRRTTRDEFVDQDLRTMRRIDVLLPNSPLTYDGVILKIRWCVRVRLFLTKGREFLEERDFVLGCVPPAVAVESRKQDDAASEDTNGNESTSESTATTGS